jgi:hypothetical protein
MCPQVAIVLRTGFNPFNGLHFGNGKRVCHSETRSTTVDLMSAPTEPKLCCGLLGKHLCLESGQPVTPCLA